jgi:integrase
MRAIEFRQSGALAVPTSEHFSVQALSDYIDGQPLHDPDSGNTLTIVDDMIQHNPALHYLHQYQGATRLTYLRVLRHIVGPAFLVFPYSALTLVKVQKMMNRLYEELDLSARSKRLYLSVLKGVIKASFALDEFQSEREYIKIMNLKSSDKAGKSPYRALKMHEIRGILQKIDSQKNPVKVIRDKALVMFMLYTGLRCNEVQRLQMRDLDLNDMTIHVTGKGNKIRVVDINKALLPYLEAWLAHRNPRPDHNQTKAYQHPVFQSLTKKSATHRAMSQTSIFDTCVYPGMSSSQIKAVNKTQSTGYHLSAPHQLRRTFATMADAQNVDLQIISDWLGHADVETTKIYIKNAKDRDDAKRAMDALSFE